jgi:hypothetical protein
MSSSNLSFACTPLHCTLGLITHARHAALARDSDCLGWSDARHVIGLHLDAGLTGPSSQLTSLPSPSLHFPSLTLPKFTPMEFAPRAILARLPGRQYQRDASKHHRSCPPIRVRYQCSSSGPAVVVEGRSRLCSPWPGAFIGISSFYYYSYYYYPYSYSYYGSIRSFVLRATLRLAGAVPPQRDPGTLAPIPI